MIKIFILFILFNFSIIQFCFADRVCLRKSDNKLIEYQSGNASLGILTQNAINAGYQTDEIEEKYVTPEEWETIKNEQIVIPSQNATEAERTKNIPQVTIDKNKEEGMGLDWVYRLNKDGRELSIDMFNAIRDLEVVTGKQYIYTNEGTDIRKSELKDEIENIKKIHEKVKELEEE